MHFWFFFFFKSLFLSFSDTTLALGEVDILELTASQERLLNEDIQAVLDSDAFTSPQTQEVASNGAVVNHVTTSSVQPVLSTPVIQHPPVNPTVNFDMFQDIQNRQQSNTPIYYFQNSTVNFIQSGIYWLSYGFTGVFIYLIKWIYTPLVKGF